MMGPDLTPKGDDIALKEIPPSFPASENTALLPRENSSSIKKQEILVSGLVVFSLFACAGISIFALPCLVFLAAALIAGVIFYLAPSNRTTICVDFKNSDPLVIEAVTGDGECVDDSDDYYSPFSQRSNDTDTAIQSCTTRGPFGRKTVDSTLEVSLPHEDNFLILDLRACASGQPASLEFSNAPLANTSLCQDGDSGRCVTFSAPENESLAISAPHNSQGCFVITDKAAQAALLLGKWFSDAVKVPGVNAPPEFTLSQGSRHTMFGRFPGCPASSAASSLPSPLVALLT